MLTKAVTGFTGYQSLFYIELLPAKKVMGFGNRAICVFLLFRLSCIALDILTGLSQFLRSKNSAKPLAKFAINK